MHHFGIKMTMNVGLFMYFANLCSPKRKSHKVLFDFFCSFNSAQGTHLTTVKAQKNQMIHGLLLISL